MHVEPVAVREPHAYSLFDRRAGSAMSRARKSSSSAAFIASSALTSASDCMSIPDGLCSYSVLIKKYMWKQYKNVLEHVNGVRVCNCSGPSLLIETTDVVTQGSVDSYRLCQVSY